MDFLLWLNETLVLNGGKCELISNSKEGENTVAKIPLSGPEVKMVMDDWATGVDIEISWMADEEEKKDLAQELHMLHQVRYDSVQPL